VNDRNPDSRDVEILHTGRELGGVRSLAGSNGHAAFGVIRIGGPR